MDLSGNQRWPPSEIPPGPFYRSAGLAANGSRLYSTITRLPVSRQNGIGGAPALSVSTSNSSCSRIMRRNQSWASRALWMPYRVSGTTNPRNHDLENPVVARPWVKLVRIRWVMLVRSDIARRRWF